MNSRRALGILACVQLGLAAITWWPSDGGKGPQPFLDFARDDVTQIEIAGSSESGESGAGLESGEGVKSGADANKVVLAREDGAWTVETAAGYRARPDKIEELLGHLLGLKVGAPVAERPESHNALKVGAEQYGRRITVTAGDARKSFLLGAATSKSVNLRREDEDEVYSASGVSEWGFSDATSAYYEPLYVSATPADLTEFTVRNEHGTLRFTRQGEGFTLADLLPDEQVDPAAIDRFIGSVTKLRMTRPVGQTIEEAFALGDATAPARVDWTIAAENQSIGGGYAIGAGIEGDRYAKAVDSPFVVRVLEGATTRLFGAQRSEFLVGAGE